MQITTATEPSFTIDIRTAGRSNVRLDVAPLSDPTDVISIPLSRTELWQHLQDGNALFVPEVGVWHARHHDVRLTPDEVALLTDLIGELRGLAKVASRI